MDDIEKKSFGAADYVVVASMLALSLAIGFYQACSGGRQRTTEEFLMADRNMNPVPVAMSLVATFVSAITSLGTPAETYVNGFIFVWYSLSTGIAAFAAMTLFLPIFYSLGVTSANEYLERRFNKVIRYLGTGIFCFNMMIYLGIVLYAPSLALSAVTGLHLWGSVFAIGIVCTLYTTVGGMKAVLWTDTFQISLMMIGFLAAIIQGSINIGGIEKAWQIAKEHERMNVWVWSTDVTLRHTIWGIIIGGATNWLSTFGCNQAQVQRYLTCGSLATAKIAIFIAIFGMAAVQISPCIVGIVMYANYVGCDPKQIGLIDSYDQMMPYFIMDLFGTMPGLPGLLTSAVFSAALSTISSGLNALAAVAGEDIVKKIWPNMSEGRYTRVTKGLALFFGLLTLASAIVASKLGSILQTAMNIFGMFGGPILGMFSSGIFFPWVNSKGALTGTLLGLVYSFWLGLGAQFHPNPPYRPPLTILNCTVENTTLYSITDDVTVMPAFITEELSTTDDDVPLVEYFYRLSYTWWGVTSCLMTLVVSNVVSLLTGRQDPKKLDPRLICPIVDKMYCCLPEKLKKILRCRVGEEYLGEQKDPDYELMKPEKMQVKKECLEEEEENTHLNKEEGQESQRNLLVTNSTDENGTSV
ncbi:sodium-coupled monocarboxylate transporter 2-like [Diadema antillarum]|uniref:sodium-coupled monocarboxylate transporter 2-like n=1 Tax=Diadema antillarum TaxID=105358 RepID=UPI003A86AED7